MHVPTVNDVTTPVQEYIFLLKPSNFKWSLPTDHLTFIKATVNCVVFVACVCVFVAHVCHIDELVKTDKCKEVF